MEPFITEHRASCKNSVIKHSYKKVQRITTLFLFNIYVNA